MFFLMTWRPPSSTRTYTLVPYTTLFRSHRSACCRLADLYVREAGHRARFRRFVPHQPDRLHARTARRRDFFRIVRQEQDGAGHPPDGDRGYGVGASLQLASDLRVEKAREPRRQTAIDDMPENQLQSENSREGKEWI